jgi:nitroreductase
MSVLDVIKTRRSIRSFDDESISDEDAEKILDAARLAPSGGNRQRWDFIYVKDPRVLRMIKNCSPGLYGDPVAVVVIGMKMVKAPFGGADYGSIVGVLDIGFAAENILLAAHALGLGGCAIASFNESGIKKVIDAPAAWRPILLVSLGYPSEQPKMPPKKQLSEVVHLDRYGRKWERLEGKT